MSRRTRADDRRAVIADREADLDLEEVRDNLRRPYAIGGDGRYHYEVVFAAAFGADGPPPGFDASLWRQPPHLAALERWAAGVARTPPEHRAFHLSLIRIVAAEWTAYASRVRGKVGFWALTRDVETVGHFLNTVNGRDREPVPLLRCALEWISEEYDFHREPGDRWVAGDELDRLGLTRQERAWFVLEALKDPALRGRAVTLLADCLSGAAYADVLACALAGLVDDPDPDVRRWAVVQLAAAGPGFPGITDRFWAAAAEGYGEEPSAWGVAPFDDYVERAFDWNQSAAVDTAAVPFLLKLVSHGPSSRRIDALFALARLGVRAAAVLVGLEQLAEDELADPEFRATARTALDRLATGGASAAVSPNPDEGFLLAVWRNPHDETARLVYADWLDDHDHAERAEYVRLGVELARLPAGESIPEELRERAERLNGSVPGSAWRELWDRLGARVTRLPE